MGGGGGRAVGGVWAARSRRTSEVAAHGTRGGWSVGERFFCRRACRTEIARGSFGKLRTGSSTARRPAHPAPSAAVFPSPPPQATRRSAQDDRLLGERSDRSPNRIAPAKNPQPCGLCLVTRALASPSRCLPFTPK